MIYLVALGLLGREVGGCAHDRAGLRQIRIGVGNHGGGNAKVGNLHLTLGRNEHVAGLDVAVDDTTLVRKPECGGYVERHPGDLLNGEVAVTAQDLRQALAFDVLHHDVVRAHLLAPVIDGDDVWVVQVCGRLCFAAEPLDEFRVGCILGKEHLDGDGTAEQLVARQEDVGHASPGQPAVQLVSPTKDGGAFRGHRCNVTGASPQNLGMGDETPY